MLIEHYQHFKKLLLAFTTLVAVLGALLPAFAQEGEWHLGDDDGRLNVDTHLGGANVYCVDQWKQGATTYAEGGGFLVTDQNGQEMLFVPEATINTALEALAATGEYQLLGVSERAWYHGAPIYMYLLSNGEFQVNAADEWGKPIDFQWSECRNFTITTSDGCAPAWDRDSSGVCVHQNLY